jgi:hypothetical protein
MRLHQRGSVCCAALLYVAGALILPAGSATAAPTGVLTEHNDNARTGLYADERTLTPANVNVRQFGKLFSLPVDGYVYAQPLVMAGVPIPDRGRHNVLFVATEHNSVYAFDADDNAGANAAPLWHVNLGPAVPQPDVISNDLVPEVGITGTPVIDPRSGTLYVVAKTREEGTWYQHLHALDVTTGAERPNSPVLITASVPGSGDGNDGHGGVPFQPLREHQRGGLCLSHGTVYVSWASHGDHGPYHGWLIGYDATTLLQTMAFNDTPDDSAGGIWMSGMGPAADRDGNIYVSTGNGGFNANSAGGRNYGDSVLKIAPDGRVAGYFTPFNQANLNASDNDLGSGGVMLLPARHDDPRRLLVTAGKEGRVYLIDRDDPGGYHADRDDILQALPGAVGFGSFGTPAAFQDRVYYQGSGDVLKAFALGRTSATVQNIDGSRGFAATDFTVNGSAHFSGAHVRLTDGGSTEAGSVWANHAVGTGRFTTAFQFQITDPGADGMTFALQRAGPTAVGAAGGGLGYGGIGQSLCIKFDLYDNSGEGANSTGLYVGGKTPDVPATDLTSGGVDLHSGRPFDVTITYDGQVMTVEIKDAVYHDRTATQRYTIDIPAVIGGPTAFAGFTGATGGLTSTIDIDSWSFSSSSTSGVLDIFGLSPQPVSQSAARFGFPGATPSISARGSRDGIVWVTQNTNPNPGDHTVAAECVLHAYDAEHLTRELYNSTQAPDHRDTVGQYVKFSVPTIFRGKVYVGAAADVAVYGLLPQPPSAPL